jgi:hypothetical protein
MNSDWDPQNFFTGGGRECHTALPHLSDPGLSMTRLKSITTSPRCGRFVHLVVSAAIIAQECKDPFLNLAGGLHSQYTASLIQSYPNGQSTNPSICSLQHI